MSTDLTHDHDAWLSELTFELRMLDVPGADIGDAVASAREFLRDSGVPAREAFGEPREYAAALGLAPAPGADDRLRFAVLRGTVGLLGFFAVAFAGGPAWLGEPLVPDLSIVVLLVTAVLVVEAAPRYFSVVVRAPAWVVGVGGAVVLGLQVLVVLLLGDVDLPSVPARPVAIVGAVVLLGHVVWTHLHAGEGDDPVTEPLGSAATSRAAWWVTVLPPWVMLLAAVGFAVLDVLLRR